VTHVRRGLLSAVAFCRRMLIKLRGRSFPHIMGSFVSSLRSTCHVNIGSIKVGSSDEVNMRSG